MQKVVQARRSRIKTKGKPRKNGKVTRFQNSERVISCDLAKEKHWCESGENKREIKGERTGQNIAPITID